MDAAIVIPCLNEAANLASTCASLGFNGERKAPENAILVLVDNDSADATPAVMAQLRDASPDRVLLAHELERGYVPPRRRGVAVAAAHLAARGGAADDLLIVQADADTHYEPGYVAHLLEAAAASTPGTLLEGVAAPPPAFMRTHPGFHRHAEQADDSVEPLLVDEGDEIVIDDQVAAFRLSDYLAWGGHEREYDEVGEEIHAETSRLYLRGRMMGAVRRRVPDARAIPSRRKVEFAPLRYFATSGFPREDRWRASWREPAEPGEVFAVFEQPGAAETFADAIFLRQAHLLLLFGFIPAYVQRLLGRSERRGVLESPLAELLPSVSHITAADIASHPGRLFSASLPLLNSHKGLFAECLAPNGG